MRVVPYNLYIGMFLFTLSPLLHAFVCPGTGSRSQEPVGSGVGHRSTHDFALLKEPRAQWCVRNVNVITFFFVFMLTIFSHQCYNRLVHYSWTLIM